MSFAEKYGPWALISGASEGTGAAFAHELADKGLNLILVARRLAPLEKLAEELRAKGAEVVAASIDLTAQDASAQIIAETGAREVGLFIANAGADTWNQSFTENDIENWDQLVSLNISSTMRNVHHFARAMRARGKGGIMLIGSGSGYGGLNGMAIYCAAKAFQLTFAEALWAELRHDNVDVLAYILGRTDTPAHREILAHNKLPVPSDMANPADVAKMGLAQLPFGPIQNWGENESSTGMSPISPANRRARILAIEEMSRAYLSK